MLRMPGGVRPGHACLVEAACGRINQPPFDCAGSLALAPLRMPGGGATACSLNVPCRRAERHACMLSRSGLRANQPAASRPSTALARWRSPAEYACIPLRMPGGGATACSLNVPCRRAERHACMLSRSGLRANQPAARRPSTALARWRSPAEYACIPLRMPRGGAIACSLNVPCRRAERHASHAWGR